MKSTRLILSGVLLWLFVFSIFAALSFVPVIQNSEALQGVIIGLCLIPFSFFITTFYFKKDNKTNGMPIAIILVCIALVMDVLITVPLFEIPYNGRGYVAFFTNPLLWILVVENIIIIYLTWRLRVRSSS